MKLQEILLFQREHWQGYNTMISKKSW
jgi:hypothetical protein